MQNKPSMIKSSRTDVAFSSLKSALISGKYAPGMRLRIDTLSKEFDISVGAIREGLSRLTAEGLVVAQPQRGFIVAPISKKDLLHLTEARVELENQCLSLSIQNGNFDWEGRVLAINHQLKAMSNHYIETGTNFPEKWHDMHKEFHDVLTSACPNQWFLRLRQGLFNQSERYRRIYIPGKGTARDVNNEHQDIVDATLAKDITQAKKLIAAHLWRTTDLILDADLPFID